ncbi:MAG: rod shape-determining protein RodA, partial [Candidatus Omnitrophica bacterium]|nr:rod shape-determining protein RodA [Candidatus Omnitrophota bacterium]
MRISLSDSRRWDRGLLGASLVLALISGLAMASAAATANPALLLRHLLWMAIGLLASIGVARTDYRRWTDLAGIAYGASLVTLILVPIAGAMRLGATRWLSIGGFSVQPSEFAKLTTTWLLARYLAGQPTPLPRRVVLTSLGLVVPPALLVLLQPDLGSASVFGAIWLGTVWATGASGRVIGGCAGGLLVLSPLAWWHVLKEYQRDRLMIFLNPQADPLGAGYSIIQSTIAIGSGRVWGRGWFAGTQSQLNFLPERHSDFIFSVIGEEWGALGSLILLGTFVVLLVRALQISLTTLEPQGRLLAIGIFSWIAYQTVVNVGMVMGLLPVVGVPLPLVSYGGSSMIVLWVALGLLQ